MPSAKSSMRHNFQEEVTVEDILAAARHPDLFQQFWSAMQHTPDWKPLVLGVFSWSPVAASSADDATERAGSIGRYFSYGVFASIGEDTLETKMLLANNRIDVAHFAYDRFIRSDSQLLVGYADN